ncbi:MAG: SHD1 domain-containing protein [Rubripirellula sp.]
MSQPTRQSTVSLARAVAWATVSVASLFASQAKAQHDERIWVDAGGTYSVHATLIDWFDDSVVLLRSDGGQVRLSMGQLSELDKSYVAERKLSGGGLNGLRGGPPTPPEIAPLPPLKLPTAAELGDTADAAATPMAMDGEVQTVKLDSLPESLPADRSLYEIGLTNRRIAIPRVDFNTTVSAPNAITMSGDEDKPTVALAMSISHHIRLPGEKTRQELVAFDILNQRVGVPMQHSETIRLLDHRMASGKSLVLVGFNSLGRGGDLAVVDGWMDGSLELSRRRPVSGKTDPGAMHQLRFAKWIDDEHVLAIIDQSLGLWNIVSGKQIYRVDGIESRSMPALSGGGRYLAIPYEGGVDLMATETGKSLGRIKVEKQVPGVAFSPQGDMLAIATTRRVRAWDLPSAALAGDVRSLNSLGLGKPLWIDHDLLLTDDGTLVSLHRGVPLWRYDVAGTQRQSFGKHIAIFRKTPLTEMTVVSIPHPAAQQMIQRIDASPTPIQPDKWRVLGRSGWGSGGWVDRDVQIGGLTNGRR